MTYVALVVGWYQQATLLLRGWVSRRYIWYLNKYHLIVEVMLCKDEKMRQPMHPSS